MLETIDFITQTLLEQKGKLDRFDPPVVYESTRWQQWVTQPAPIACFKTAAFIAGRSSPRSHRRCIPTASAGTPRSGKSRRVWLRIRG